MDSGGPNSLELEIAASLAADRVAGTVRPLQEYLARFPGHDDLVAREFLRGSDTSVPGTDAEAAREVDGERVGPYVLERELGRGGQGAVWLARDPRLDRPVALKVVALSPVAGAPSPRFRREARTASRIEHPGLCPVYDVGTEGALAWIAMRYVPGETLQQMLSKRAGPPADTNTLIALFEQVARALHAAHQGGIVHRDVKPANVMVTPQGEPVLLDFGVAKEEEDGPPLTLTGDTLGTPAYMSPEQLDGERTDARADVWSLGATAYELLTGARPFEAPTRDALALAIARRDPEPASSHNPAVPRDLDVVLATALTKEVDGRYQSALALAEDLRRVRERRPILARPAGVATRLARWGRRNPAVAASVAAVFLVLAGALAISTHLLGRTREALDANTTLLDEVTQLSDAKGANDLLAEEPLLWPASPERAPDMHTWLQRARDLEARLATHRRSLEAVGERLTSTVTAQLASSADVETDAWMHEQLTRIVASIEALIVALPRVEARYELARTLAEVTVDERRGDWAAAAERVRADPRFGGLELAPQRGLIPLGTDPASGLEEFAHLPSGTPPTRDPASGRLTLADAGSIVLILVPGGDSTLGCRPPSREHPDGAPFVDPRARGADGPLQHLTLDPFFVSKYEMTTAQWERHTEFNPSLYGGRPGGTYADLVAPWQQPAEQVSWTDSKRVLDQLELVIPTEAQWEHAARGGTSDVWYTGDEPESLRGHENLADEGSRDHGGPERWEYEYWLVDGYVTTAPVGRFAPNRFGLHDVSGNVCEWTFDNTCDLRAYPPRDGDGATQAPANARVVRGGSYAKPAVHGRMGYRVYLPAHLSPPDVGLRPARRLDGPATTPR